MAFSTRENKRKRRMQKKKKKFNIKKLQINMSQGAK